MELTGLNRKSRKVFRTASHLDIDFCTGNIGFIYIFLNVRVARVKPGSFIHHKF